MVEFHLGVDQLSFLNDRIERVVEPGVFEILEGMSSAELQTVRREVEK